MVNLSGTLCYMNSVLQSLASLYHLRLHLKLLVDLAVDLDIETPVSDAVFDTLYDLNQPSATQPAPLRPLDLLSALVELPQIRRMLGTREQQDAHELFVVLAGAISDEATKVAKENDLRKAGLSHASDLSTPSPRSSPAPSLTIRRRRPDRSAPTPLPWEGLLARRRTCAACGYADVVRLDTMGGMELSIPRNVS
jgi:ubiquitin carboxyl-terminal hydrolase 1